MHRFKKITSLNFIFEISFYILGCSFFFGNAVMSIALAIFIVFSIPIVVKNFQIKQFIKNWGLIFLCIYFFCHALVLIIFADNLNEFIKIKKLLPFVFLPIILFSSRDKLFNSKQVLHNFYKFYVHTALLSFIMSFIYGTYRALFIGTSFNSIYITYNELSTLFGVQPIYLAVFYLMAILFCMKFIEETPRDNKRYLYFIFILSIAIILLSSRTSILMLFIIIVYKLFKSILKLKTKKALIAIPIIVITSVVLIQMIPTLKSRTLEFNKNIASYSGLEFRTKLWKNSYMVFQQSPIYGFGFYKSQDQLIKQYKKTNFRRALINDFNTHNQYLQSSVDAGIIGLLSLLIILIHLIYYSKPDFLQLWFSIIIIISLVSESFLNRQYGILFFTFFASIFFTLKTKSS